MATATLTGPLATHDGPPTHSYRLTAPSAEQNPKVARDMVASLLEAAGHGASVDAARLLVSELVTNVWQHADTCQLTVETTIDGASITVRVTDGDFRNTPPMPHSFPEVGDEHGRGLALVDALATRWGVTVHGGREPARKSVWFVLVDRSSAGGADHAEEPSR
ncbi:regulatory protein [Streptomyces bingchenggensis BCW-1]|uniref:Regulatory protein n=1 Tax=Streptomyces bingchenggensis (strain BCW-1) TaxID=749414 RepID=D7BVQ6_STRBB|nr:MULTISPECIES: ATP-binding protein [Streptomyces]ADI09635.1 regulatory protein [Streptomyces bingchenggensis BCW-1]